MMHFEETIVTLVGNDNRPWREFEAKRLDKGRTCKVFIPTDTEYKFLIKNNSDRRIKICIDIDGTNVSGNGLILNSHETDYIERFVDQARKFKTSKVTGDGVADPTSPENGIIKVRVVKEKYVPPVRHDPPIEHHHHHHHWDYPGYWNRTIYGGSWGSSSHTYGGVLRSSNIGTKGINANYSAPVNSPDTVTTAAYNTTYTGGDPLATVEGDVSSQRFSTTTWAGDEGEPTVFTFYIKESSTVEDKQYQEYLRLKNIYG